MVNRGRLSLACAPCRAKKLRCDLQPDTCGQCRRARTICHGYRNPDALQFHDESLSIETKVVARRSKTPVKLLPTQPTGFELSWDAKARYAFFSTYIASFTRSMGEVPFYYRTAQASDHLSASVEAASLAFMGSQLHSAQLIGLANSRYIVAIRRLNHALVNMDPQQAEELLQSVLLLDMYEKMVHRKPGATQSWISHAKGGLSLLDTHARDIISTPTGCQLAARLTAAVTVTSMTVGECIPNQLMALRRNIHHRVHSPKWTFLGILAHIANLKTQADRGEISKAQIVLKARGLYSQLDELDRMRTSSWEPQRIQNTGENTLVLGDYYDVYPDHYINQVSNAFRTARLLLHKIIRQHAPEHFNQSAEDSCGDIDRMVDQTCASVPQFILRGVRDTNALPFSPLQQLQCSTLLAPLFFVHQMTGNPLVQSWIGRCLNFMWTSGGLRAAKEVLELIETQPDLDYWTVHAMTGSYAFTA